LPRYFQSIHRRILEAVTFMPQTTKELAKRCGSKWSWKGNRYFEGAIREVWYAGLIYESNLGWVLARDNAELVARHAPAEGQDRGRHPLA
jgi:hypothetical protein